jgi:RES domain-containing protein
MSRALRPAPSQDRFDAIVFPAVPAPLPSALPRVRLGSRAYPSQFYANPRSRLTPVSLSFPCVYLADSEETAVAEVWGDRFWQHRENNRETFTIDAGLARAACFLAAADLPPPPLQLCDLTHADVRLALGLEAGTLYATDLSYPQTWAERIALHPRKFDGILYRSRLTEGRCLVLWQRPGGRNLERTLAFIKTGDFHDSAHVYQVGAKCQIRVAFAP